MKTISRVLFTFWACMGLFANIALPVNASTPTYGHGYANGVGNLTVYLDTGSGVGYWQMYINGDYFSQQSFTNFMAQQVVTHSVGHALGLDDYMLVSKQSIMYPEWENSIYNTVNHCDNEAILDLY